MNHMTKAIGLDAATSRRGLRRMLTVTLAVLGALCVWAPGAWAIYGDDFALATAPAGSAFPGSTAFWAGTCDLAHPTAAFGTAPSSPRDCIDAGSPATPTTQSVWSSVPSWRLAPAPQAGAHPDATTTFMFSRSAEHSFGSSMYGPSGQAKDIAIQLPPGLIGDATAVQACSGFGFHEIPPNCPPTSQIGVVTSSETTFGFVVQEIRPVYLLEPRTGNTAEIGVPAQSSAVPVIASVRTDGDFGLTTTLTGIPTGVALYGSTVTFWGVPWAASHDLWRPGTLAASVMAYTPAGLAPANQGHYDPSWGPIKPFLSNPTSCTTDPPVTTMRFDSWQHKDDWHVQPAPADAAVSGCAKVPFAPTIKAVPTSTAIDSPSGLNVDITVPQNPGPPAAQQTSADGATGAPAYWASDAGLASGHLHKAVVTLPKGMTVSPSAASGLAGCSDAQLGFHGDGTFSNDAPACPDGTKVGTMSVVTPVLAHTDSNGNDVANLTGDVYLGTPNCGPCTDADAAGGRMLRLFLVGRNADRGLLVKLAGTVAADPSTGQLTATFDNNPQVPFSSLHLELKGGPRGLLATPAICGVGTTNASFTPWSGNAAATPTDAFSTSRDGAGADCPATLPFAPTLNAGTVSAAAGASSPFTFDIGRADGQDIVNGLKVGLPTGLLAAVKDVPLCGDADANAGTCPAGTRVGSATVASGPGSSPFYIGDQPVSLTGPYKGAPYGLAIAIRAIAGPFDLGTVVVRQALQIDPNDAHVTAVSDPLPTILAGVPLRLRQIHVDIDRPGFMQTPTSCDAKTITSAVSSLGGQTANLSTPYQVTGCGNLAFAPKIAMGFTNRSQVHKRKKPGLDFRLSQKSGEANIKSVTVKLPRSVVLDVNGASGALCEVAQAENGTCPASSIVGHATALTPLLDQPLSGAVYFVRGDNALPNIMVALRGQISINLRSKSKVDKMGRLISTFGTVPDAPISQFHLTLRSAGHGVLSVAPDSDLCTGHNSKGKVSVGIVGQNGVSRVLALKIKTPCRLPRKHKRSVKQRSR